MTANVAELKKSVEFFDEKYEDVLSWSQFRLANEKLMQQSWKLNELESAFQNESKKNQEATATFECMAQYLHGNCLGISVIPPSEDYSTNDMVIPQYITSPSIAFFFVLAIIFGRKGYYILNN